MRHKKLEVEVEKNEASMEEVMAMRKKQLAKFEEDESELLQSLRSVKAATAVVKGASFVQRSEGIGQTLQKILARPGLH